MRLVTGATARSSISKLYADTSFLDIKTRCQNSMLCMLYKIKHNLCPSYLNDILPPENNEIIRYNLRNRDDIVQPNTRLDSLKRSFIPASIEKWNQLPIDARNLNLENFKSYLKNKAGEKNVLFYYGQRWPSIHHARLRIGCSKLRYDLCFNLHVLEDASCDCQAVIEDAFHYFMSCPLYDEQRRSLRNVVLPLADFSIDNLLYGDPDCSVAENQAICDAVHCFILETGRFN